MTAQPPVTALSRAIADPRPVDGLAVRSPMSGLDRRSLGFVDVLAQSVGAVAPSAAAATCPVLVAARAGSGTLLAFLLAAVLMALVAHAVNQFTRRMAATGSLYTFAARGLGVRTGFATSVAMIVGYGFVAMFALLGAAYYTLTLLSHTSPGLAGSRGLVLLLLVAFGGLCLLVLWRGIRLSTRVTLVIELLSIAAILVLIAVLLVRVPGTSFWSVALPRDVGLPQLAAGTTVAVTAFVGFESAATLGAESRRPFATIPRTIRWTVIAAGVLYLLSAYTQLAGFDALGGELASSASPVNDLAARAGVEWIGLLLDGALACSFLACALASTTALARVLFSLGREGIAPRALGRTHRRFRTPHIALAVGLGAEVAVPAVLVAGGMGAWQAMGVIVVCAAAGYMTAYALVCVAAPFFLRRIGELTAGPAVTAGIAAAGLIGALGLDLGLEAAGPRALAVVLLAVVAVIAVALFLVCRRRRAEALSRIGLYDEPTTGDVLGGAP
ncbi:APC family permease [Leifsonia aquatica]|uniref:APC family permease n=1 Tax=Leifsonia aquatica TaxID=144185 RepID=UPI001F06D81C|nr:APC family permease [Leifsonia aquatica]